MKIKSKIYIFLLVFTTAVLINHTNNILMESALAISQMQAKAKINIIADTSVKETIENMNLSAEDFYISNTGIGTGAISTNTVLVNQMCTEVSSNINYQLVRFSNEKIPVPVGSVTGIGIFANMGPDIKFEIVPKSSVDVDYETSFLSVGINQTNYQVWLNVKVEVQIVNPLKSKNVIFERKIALVDTLINGEVPERYMNFQNN